MVSKWSCPQILDLGGNDREGQTLCGKFHSNFQRKSTAAFAYIIFDAFIATAVGKTAPKYGARCKRSNLKFKVTILAQMLVKHNSIFCSVYFALVHLHIAQIGQ